eukprot:scaffold267_cov192-Amphora_coffeaeformis.AAC.2
MPPQQQQDKEIISTTTATTTTMSSSKQTMMDPRIILYAFLTYLDHVRWILTDQERSGGGGGGGGGGVVTTGSMPTMMMMMTMTMTMTVMMNLWYMLAFGFVMVYLVMMMTMMTMALGQEELEKEAKDVSDVTNNNKNYYKWSTLAVALSILMGAGRVMAGAPFLWDSEYISCGLTDMFVGVGLLLHLQESSSNTNTTNNNNNTDTTTTTTTMMICRVVRDQFAWFYLAAGVWKLNTHFWDANASCATMFFTQIVTRYLAVIAVPLGAPDNLVEEERAVYLMGMIQPWAPLLTLAIELGMGGLQAAGMLWNWRQGGRWGAVLTVLFHLAVCVVPPPNDISPFAVRCGSRLIMYASYQGAHKSLLWLQKWSMTIVVVTALVIAHGRQHDWNIMNWAFAQYILVLAIVGQALWDKDDDATDEPNTSTIPVRRNWWCWLGSALAFFYAFGTIMLGLQEQGTPNMFANLKIHGGSNHFFLPTGLLFHWYGNFPDSHPFGGGVLRVESTTSEWMNFMYPADMTDMLQPTIYPTVLEKLGVPRPHFFNPGANRVANVMRFAPQHHPPTTFYRYTIPALEMKRLFVEAKQKDRDFDIVYSKLPGTRGDEIWRATAVEQRFVVQVRGGIVERCTVVHVATMMSSDCGPTDLPMLPDDNIPWILRRFSLYHAYPIVTNRREDIPPSIICFGP